MLYVTAVRGNSGLSLKTERVYVTVDNPCLYLYYVVRKLMQVFHLQRWSGIFWQNFTLELLQGWFCVLPHCLVVLNIDYFTADFVGNKWTCQSSNFGRFASTNSSSVVPRRKQSEHQPDRLRRERN